MRNIALLSVVAAFLVGCVATEAAPSGLDTYGSLQSVIPAASKDFAFTRLENGVQFRVNGVTKNVIFYGPNTVRVNANLGKSHWTAPSIVVIGKPSAVRFDLKEDASSLTVLSKQIRVVADKKSGALSFLRADGTLYTRERAEQPHTIKPMMVENAPTYEVENTFTLKPDEGIYGFGFIGEGQVNRRGQELLLIQTNVGIIIPVMVSSENYGVMWDTYSVMKFKDSVEGAKLWAESAPGGVDYYFFGGENLDQVVGAYRDLTGDAPMYPKQAFGLFMSKERYPTQARITEVARKFREEKFPLDYIVQDWQYWGSDKDGTWSGMIWNPERFPDPEGLTKDIHDLNMKLMVSIWPSIGNDTELAKELDEHGLRFDPLHWISKRARVYDAYSQKGREIYFKHVKKGLLDKGVDALWMDGTEVEFTTACWGPWEVARDIKSVRQTALGDSTRYLNPYSLMTTLGTYEGQRATSDKRVFTLTRSGWAGAQRTAAASWSGDIYASWKTFQEQISGGVNVTVTGNPYWTQDTGGFFVTEFPGGENSPAYQELFTRWFQYSVFNPIMRVHGTSIEREPYIFKDKNPEMYAALLEAVHLRYRLLPYIYSLGWQVTNADYTLMRPLVMDFAADQKIRSINDTFMFGPSLLVQPVTRAMYHVKNPPAAVILADNLRTLSGQPGLDGQYYAGTNFETPRGKVVDKTIDHRWPGPPLAGPPGGLDGFNNFSARWEGKIVASEDGTYDIGVEGDDGYRLFLDEAKVIEDWRPGAKRSREIKKTLSKGQELSVKLEYFQGGYDRSLRLTWRTPSDILKMEAEKEGLNTTMETYLPAGTGWYNFWTNEAHGGGQIVKTEAPLKRFPLFVRAGSILPMGPVLQYATENPGAPYEIRVYPGADATFTIYEDDNETYSYEKGERATYDLVWNDAAKTLSIGARKGTFPGLVKERQLKIVIPGNEASAKTIFYKGKAMKVRLGA
jgi:alpha-D-xyloside xylohydrolase